MVILWEGDFWEISDFKAGGILVGTRDQSRSSFNMRTMKIHIPRFPLSIIHSLR